jgi:glycosyl transferase family 25
MLDREQIAWRRMPAVDGRHGMPESDYDYDEAAAIIRHDRPLNTGEIGCYLSHIKALRMFLAGEAACAVVLEDDIDIPSGTFKNLNAIAEKLDEFYDDTWDCVNFGSAQRPGFQDVAFIENGIEVRRSTFLPVSLPGVMWTRAGQRPIQTVYLVTKFAVLWIRKCARILRAAGGPLSPLTP